MPSTLPLQRVFRLSLRELFVLVALVALAMMSLKYASDVWLAVVTAITMLAFFVSLIVAAVDRSSRQAFAIGFALAMASYYIIVINAPYASGDDKNREFDPWDGKLPTTRLLRYVHMTVDSGDYYNIFTGAEVPNYNPADYPNRGAGGMAGSGPTVSYRESPPREIFMPIGHSWWTLILGYAGGHFARFVYWRRFREEQKLPAETS